MKLALNGNLIAMPNNPDEPATTRREDESGLPKMMSRVLACRYTADTGSLTASEPGTQ